MRIQCGCRLYAATKSVSQRKVKGQGCRERCSIDQVGKKTNRTLGLLTREAEDRAKWIQTVEFLTPTERRI